jgi:hypothetical protein
MAEDPRGDVIPLALARVHPDFRGLSMIEIRGKLAALLFHASEEQVTRATWALGPDLGAALTHELHLLSESGHLDLEDRNDGGVDVAGPDHQIDKGRKQTQLPLIRLVKSPRE